MAEKQFVYFWYKELKWDKDPFTIKHPEEINNYMTGYEKERKDLNYAIIEKVPVILITGKEGIGKTTLLLWLKEQLKHYKNLIAVDYVNRKVNFIEFLKELIKPLMTIKEHLAITISITTIKSYDLIKDENLKSIYSALYLHKSELDLNIIGKFIAERLKGKQLVLLIDDLNKIEENYVKLLTILSSIEGVQLVIANENPTLEKLGKKDLMKIELKGLNNEEAKELLLKRLKGIKVKTIEPFTDKQVNEINKKTEGNPLKFLGMIREKAIDIALTKSKESKKEKLELDLTTAKEEETIKENKPYEIKVINSAEDRQYNIKGTVKRKEDFVPKEVKKENREAKRIR